jgi:site-specific recombinase XerD
VLRGKGSKPRTVGMDPEGFAVLGRWLDRRSERHIDARLPLFCTLRGEPLDDRYVRTALRQAAERAGISKRVHPHGLRHTMAVELVREGVPLPEIQDQLGHASLDGTAHFIRGLYPNGAIDRMRERTGWLDQEPSRSDP